MKKITKILILIVFVAFATESFAQKFGLKAGLNFANMLNKNDYITASDEYESKTGFQVGPIVEFRLTNLLSLETGVLFSTKGFKTEDSGKLYGVNWETLSSYNLNYLDIPVYLRVGYNIGSVRVFGNIGPYIGIALSGKEKIERTVDVATEIDEYKIQIGSEKGEDNIKRTDFGLNIGISAALKEYEIGLNYGLGLANLSPSTDNGTEFKNRVFSITFAYKLSR
ncbi:MAG: hypothetical protein A2W99_04225 [Bacteroidetes bacterium GWF2_33_16]|nr:MAG: hypothetical protein A2X00_16745 [Bacteroidetes bacterium GWE2_32_14]OFY05878.1 MAG: hypothetical protein A2W99_04225 [Bacteroidetes bacterium GWF2_33_16]